MMHAQPHNQFLLFLCFLMHVCPNLKCFGRVLISLKFCQLFSGLWFFESAGIFSLVTYWPYRFLQAWSRIWIMVDALYAASCLSQVRFHLWIKVSFLTEPGLSLVSDFCLDAREALRNSVHSKKERTSILFNKPDFSLPGITDILADNWKQGPSHSCCLASQLLHEKGKWDSLITIVLDSWPLTVRHLGVEFSYFLISDEVSVRSN